jgi:hypothetical protein
MEEVWKLKKRVNFLENGLQEIRKFIENSGRDDTFKLSHVFDMTMKLSYPEESINEES